MLADKTAEGAGRELLMGLPGMTEDVADAILDWLDEDEEPREYGVESDYYMGLDPPYAAEKRSIGHRRRIAAGGGCHSATAVWHGYESKRQY